MKGNIWETLGIASLEYCKIERAANLLNCTIDDILHWAELERIELCIKLYDVKCNVAFPIGEIKSRLKFLLLWLESRDPNHYLKYENECFKMSDLSYIHPGISIDEGLEVLAQAVADCKGIEAAIDGLWAIDVDVIKRYDIDNPPVLGDSISDFFTLTVKLFDTIGCGFHNGIRELLLNTSFKLQTPDAECDGLSVTAMVGVLDKPIILSIGNVYITKRQIEKIYKASRDGFWNNDDLGVGDYPDSGLDSASLTNVAGIMEQRKGLIISIVNQHGYSPLELPYKNGVSGVKSKIREIAINSDKRMTTSSFNNAWKELLSEGRIANLGK
ncbi:hypothetical protein RDT67_14570 [Serratia fonticola]|uniref:Uncharacterized protein n=1 Tax=Serratia fonticola TaxID=47917 RepID=A0AAJ1YGU4_SERFO|nr:hypothetical protein [Serratia fonticola]MDQ9127654.1 hypothetical protein [Serratia fonticola]